MSLPRAIKGARNTGLTITWQHPDGTAHNLTGATLTGVIKNDAGTSRAIDGTLALSDAANGVFTWTYGAIDVGTAGTFLVQFKATIGGQYDLTYSEKWVVEAAL